MNISRRLRTGCARETALIVNFARQEREAVESFLSNAAYHVLTANSGDEAMELCRNYEGAIHLLVTDIEVAGVSGWDLAESAARIRPGLIVLFLSKDTMSGAADMQARAKAPVYTEVLLQVTQALARRAQQSGRPN